MESRKEIIEALKPYFDIRELVCDHTYKKFKDLSWQFLDTEILRLLLVLRRDILKVGLVINNYHIGGPYTQRGLRCNICEIPKGKTLKDELYLSAHCNGAAFDITPMFKDVEANKRAEKARQLILENKDLLPEICRLEGGVTWLHIDCYDPMNGQKVTIF